MHFWGQLVRRCALGLMLVLSVAANCTSDSYDPDPYDDTPPVTVEFEYVTPHLTTAPLRRNDLVNATATHFESERTLPVASDEAFHTLVRDFAVQTAILISAPLRR